MGDWQHALRAKYWLVKQTLRRAIDGHRFKSKLGPRAVEDCIVRRKIPHDITSFTQGLAYCDGVLVESTGLMESSGVNLLDASSGDCLRHAPIAQGWGEGCAVLDGRIFQLTWQDHKLLVYRYDDLELIERLDYPFEGWGLASEGDSLYASDGSDRIRRLSSSGETTGSIQVTVGGTPLTGINDLEVVGAFFFCNVLFDEHIYCVDRSTGQVVCAIDCWQLVSACRGSNPENILNGIAFDGESDALYVTGKRWPWIYELALPVGISLVAAN